MKWTNGLPREYYKKYKRVHCADNWFEVYQLPHNVYAITEPMHFQEVNSFLIIGSDKALLLDTGGGIGDITKVVKDLYKGEVFVVNSHFHFDHIAQNCKFKDVFIYSEEHALEQLRKGYSNAEMAFNISEEMFAINPPDSFDRNTFFIPAVNPHTFEEGHLFNLGDRELKVIHTPGHTADSIMLIDQAHKILFTGDSFYKGALYLHFNSEMYGYSNFKDFEKSMIKIIGMLDEIDFLYCSHNDIIVEPDILLKVKSAIDQINDDTSNCNSREVGLHSYGSPDDNLRRFDFEEFTIVVNI